MKNRPKIMSETVHIAGLNNVRAERQPRRGWETLLKQRTTHDKHVVLPDGPRNRFDDDDWTW